MEIRLDHHLEFSPEVRDGRPCVRGTRIAVADIVIMNLRMGQPLEEIAGKYDLELAAVHAAMAYYYDHRQEIDHRIETDQAYAEAFRKNNPSLLQSKLEALRGGRAH